MKKVRKGKKMLVTLLIAVIVVIIAVVIIVKIVNNKKNNTDNNVQEKQQVITLPETTTDSGLDAQKISMEYRKDNNETVVTMRIKNNTTSKKADEEFNAILIGPDENVLGQLRTGTNTELGVGEECEISVIYKGDMTATQRIKLGPIQ